MHTGDRRSPGRQDSPHDRTSESGNGVDFSFASPTTQNIGSCDRLGHSPPEDRFPEDGTRGRRASDSCLRADQRPALARVWPPELAQQSPRYAPADLALAWVDLRSQLRTWCDERRLRFRCRRLCPDQPPASREGESDACCDTCKQPPATVYPSRDVSRPLLKRPELPDFGSVGPVLLARSDWGARMRTPCTRFLNRSRRGSIRVC